MSCHSLDVEVQAFLADGYEYVRAHPAAIDEIFGKWDQPHIARRLSNANGEKPTVIIKRWLKDNNVPVVMGFGLLAQKMPSVSIHLAASQENIPHALLGDHGGISGAEDPEAEPVVPYFVPKSYDPALGKITINTKTTSLSGVVVGMVLVDAKGEKYLINYVDEAYFTVVVEGEAVDRRRCYILASDTNVRHKDGVAHFSDAVDIGFHAMEEAQVVLWLYYIASWLFFRFKPVLEERGIAVHTYSGTDFDRNSKYVDEAVFSRWMRFSAETTMEWTEEPITSAQLAEFNVDVEPSSSS